MNEVVRHIARRLERALVSLLLLVAPRRPHVTIQGFPLTEGNAVEMLRVCAARYAGRVFWAVPDPSQARAVLDATGADPDHRIEPVAHRSWRGLATFVTAEVAMFTHGYYGNPRPTRRKTMVNLWHGGGFKGNIMCDENGRPTIHSDYLVASTAQFGKQLAKECQLPPGGLLLTGNPRVDQFHSSGADALDRLGLPSDRPLVLWMPTFRRNSGHGLSAGWTDLAGEPVESLNEVAHRGITVLTEEFGCTVVVKPHPSDAENRIVPGARVITNEDLAAVGVQLYELIGSAAGLLTDFSSVWIDYLALDRPIGFVVPDESEYAAGRGFNPPDALDWLPGERLVTDEDYRQFGGEVINGGESSRGRRAEVREHIGHCFSDHVADSVLDKLDALHVFGDRLSPRS